MFRYTLVPAEFFNPADAHRILSEAVRLSQEDKVNYQELPQFKAVLVYAPSPDGAAPVIAELLERVSSIEEQNKVAACFDGEAVHLVIVTGEKLVVANSYPAPDIATADYFLFEGMKRFRIDPQMTALWLHEPVSREMVDSLKPYCREVRTL